jgi:hypothetical protein
LARFLKSAERVSMHLSRAQDLLPEAVSRELTAIAERRPAAATGDEQQGTSSRVNHGFAITAGPVSAGPVTKPLPIPCS